MDYKQRNQQKHYCHFDITSKTIAIFKLLKASFQFISMGLVLGEIQMKNENLNNLRDFFFGKKKISKNRFFFF